MFTPLEEKQIEKLNHRLSHDLSVGLISTEDPISDLFQKFCDELTRLVPMIRIKREEAASQHHPQIIVRSNLRYQAVPAGFELQPFLETLASLEPGTLNEAEAIKERLKINKFPANLTLFIAPQCGFCPQVVRRLIVLPMTDNRIQLTIIDGALFPEALKTHQIQSVPTILLDDQFRWTGSIPLEEIIDAINTRDPFSLGVASLESILKEGGASRLAAMMLKSQNIFPAFYDVLTHDKWPIRLGAMVAMEEIVEENPDLATEVLNPLWSRFQKLSTQIQGDILHVFGEIGDPRVISWLETVLAGKFDPEVKAAAHDAVKEISNLKISKIRK